MAHVRGKSRLERYTQTQAMGFRMGREEGDTVPGWHRLGHQLQSCPPPQMLLVLPYASV